MEEKIQMLIWIYILLKIQIALNRIHNQKKKKRKKSKNKINKISKMNLNLLIKFHYKYKNLKIIRKVLQKI